jgi:hypothetical protein
MCHLYQRHWLGDEREKFWQTLIASEAGLRMSACAFKLYRTRAATQYEPTLDRRSVGGQFSHGLKKGAVFLGPTLPKCEAALSRM